MGYRLRILTPAEVHDFAYLTFPAYRSLLGHGAMAVGAYSRGEPVGLALVMPSRNRKRAELLSLYVSLPERLNGLSGFLLEHVERTLIKAGVQSLVTSWSETLSGRVPFEKVLANNGWTSPHKRMLVLRADMDGAFGEGIRNGGGKYESSDCLPRQYAFMPWGEMTESDRAFIQSKEGKSGWYPAHANPFREERILETSLSLALKKEDEIVGWLTAHRTTPDTVRFTDVFIRDDLKRSGAVAIAMVIHAFWLQLAEGTPKLTWAIEGRNKPLVRMCESRLGGFGSLSWTLGSEKRLANETF